MSLNIEFVEKPKVMKVDPAKNKYKNPIGIWSVSTEGDCEGRSTEQLGVYMGHVAEIAFHLADKCYYSLQFKDLTGTRTSAKQIPKKITTNKKSVWVSFNVESDTWNLKDDQFIQWGRDFLNCDDRIEISRYHGGVVYYASICLILKDKN